MVKIVDNSVLIKCFLQEKGADTARLLASQMKEDPGSFALPELFFFEFTHVFNRAIPNPSREELDNFNQFIDIKVPRFPLDKEQCSYIRQYQKMGLSGYDASYLALARILGGVWLTFDRLAHQKVAHLRLSRYLND